MVYDAFFKGKIDIFDPHYNRNYIHIEDIANAVVHAIDNSDDMCGEVYNLGDDEINCTKLELAQKIKSIVPCDITINEKQKDPDQRNYRVSSQKLYDTGFECLGSLDDEIAQLSHYYSFFPLKDENRSQVEFSMRNI
jgi:nucleoside-diphosphate-sugar epimerase